MKRIPIALAGAVLALAITLPGAASAGPPDRQAGLIKVLMAVAAYKVRARQAGCLLARCSEPARSARERDDARTPPRPRLLASTEPKRQR